MADQGLQRISRGQFLGGAAALAAITGLAVPERAQAQAAKSLTLEVCWDGGTWRYDNGLSGPPLRGWTFVVSGKVFPEGTFAKGPTNPDSPGSIGTWISRGVFFYDLAEMFKGAAPHAIATHIFLLDDGQNTALVTEGMQGGGKYVRAVVGGSGLYLGASGSVVEEQAGSNETKMKLASDVEAPSLNDIFTFSLV